MGYNTFARCPNLSENENYKIKHDWISETRVESR